MAVHSSFVKVSSVNKLLLKCVNKGVHLTSVFGVHDSAKNGTMSIIGSGNGLSPIRRQAITWSNDNMC